MRNPREIELLRLLLPVGSEATLDENIRADGHPGL